MTHRILVLSICLAFLLVAHSTETQADSPFIVESREKAIADSDLNDDGLQQVTLENNESTQTVELQTCSVTRIPVNKSGMEIKINSVFNAAKALISDAEIPTCMEIIGFQCPEKGKFCSVEELDEEADIVLADELCNLQYIYLYILPQELGEELAVEVTLAPTGNAKCTAVIVGDDDLIGPIPNTDETTENEPGKEESSINDFGDDSDYEYENEKDIDDPDSLSDKEYCEMFDQVDCQTSANICSSRCMYVTCQVNNGTIQTTTDAKCVPTSWTSDQLQGMCKENSEFDQTAPENKNINYPVCNSANESSNTESNQTTDENGNTESDQTADGDVTNEDTQVINGGIPHYHILHYVGLALVSFFGVFMVVVCCYRRQFRKNKKGCFNPPNWCPNFLFPRLRGDMHMFLPIGVQRSDVEMNYEPPVPVL